MAGPRPKTPQEALPGKWKYSPETGCWEWRGALDISGYGRVWAISKQMQAHRASWLAYKGDIPNGSCVLHQCDNRRCINPDHLFLGTRGDNNADRSKKGRSFTGLHGWLAKLTESDIPKIRTLLSQGESHRSVARKFSVSHRTIGDIALGRTWIGC